MSSEVSYQASTEEDEDYLYESAFGLSDYEVYRKRMMKNDEEVIEKFDSAASNCMSGVEGRLTSTDTETAKKVQISGFNGSVSRPDKVGVNVDGKMEYFVSQMPRNLVLLCAHAYANEGAAILLKDSGYVLRLDENQLKELTEFLKQYPVSKKLRVRNRTYEIDPAGTKTEAFLADLDSTLVDVRVEAEAEEAYSSTATKFFNTKVHVSNDTDRVLTSLLMGPSYNDWQLYLQHNSVDGIPPDLTTKVLNSFEHRFGRTPDIIRLAVPLMYKNRQGLMSSNPPLTMPGERIEIDRMEPPHNESYIDEESGETRTRKIKSFGNANSSAVAIDCYSGYTFGELLSNMSNSLKTVQHFIEEFNLKGVIVKHISADSGVISQSEFQVLTPEVERYLRGIGIESERAEPYNHSRGTSSVERVIRTIKEHMRIAFTFILHNPNLADLPFTRNQILKLWGEIFLWAIVINNLKPCPNDKTKTKYEVFLKKKPNIQNIRLLPIFSVLMVTRETSSYDSSIYGRHNQIGLYVGPSMNTPGAIRAAVITNGSVKIIVTSRFTAASDGGGFNIHRHVDRGLKRLINDEVEKENDASDDEEHENDDEDITKVEKKACKRLRVNDL